MSAFFTKFFAWLLPKILDWALGAAQKEYQKRRAQFEKDAERSVINDQNLKKLSECKTLEGCIIAARDAYNGVRTGTEISK